MQMRKSPMTPALGKHFLQGCNLGTKEILKLFSAKYILVKCLLENITNMLVVCDHTFE